MIERTGKAIGADLYRVAEPGKYPERDVLQAYTKGAYQAILDHGGDSRAALLPLPVPAGVEPLLTGETNNERWMRLYDLEFADEWYFRDSYNSTSLFAMLGLSWWQDLDRHVGPNGDGVLEDEDEFRLYPAGQEWLIRELAQRSELMELRFVTSRIPEEGEIIHHPGFGSGQEVDRPYFRNKLKRLIRFLQTCRDAGDPILCSV